jgi:hypothetical protein
VIVLSPSLAIAGDVDVSPTDFRGADDWARQAPDAALLDQAGQYPACSGRTGVLTARLVDYLTALADVPGDEEQPL